MNFANWQLGTHQSVTGKVNAILVVIIIQIDLLRLRQQLASVFEVYSISDER